MGDSWNARRLTTASDLEFALNSALRPAPLPLQNALQCPPALPRAEPLQRRAASTGKGFIASGAVTGAIEKIFG